MELHQIRYMVAVAETENFTRAAERCNISQPSLSQQIINLERELGHKLFHRLGRRAVLTEAGITFLARARRILFEVDDAAREIRDNPEIERTITIGAIATVAPYLLPPVLALCRARLPHLQINVLEDFQNDLTTAVLEGELDLALVTQPVIKDQRLSVESLFSEPLMLVVGKNHPLASKKIVTVTDLQTETFIMLGTSSTLAAQVQRFCGDHNFEPKIGYRCAQVTTAKALIDLGVGIAIFPQVAVESSDRSRLVCRNLAGLAPSREIAVIRHLQRYQSRGAEQFLTLLREHTKKPVIAAG
ncbi:MAG: LysR family transcriptional regulator [Opitutae bacterium]|nr:LysR family transcriptional regulator [Opitutae bacterium]